MIIRITKQELRSTECNLTARNSYFVIRKQFSPMRAFTVAELLIVIGIIGILGGVIIFNPSRGTEGYKLLNSSEEIEAVLRRTQGLALAVTDFKGAPPAGGWGVHFDTTINCYILFADVDDDGQYDAAGEVGDPCNTSLSDPASERFERVFLPPTIIINQLRITGSVNPLAIVFEAPLLATSFNGTTAAAGDSAEVELQSTAINTLKTITINSVGNVQVQ